MSRLNLVRIAIFALSARQAAAQGCDFDPYLAMKGRGRDSIDAAVRAGPKQTELTFDLPVPPSRAAELVMTLFIRCKLPVTTNNGGVIEAKLPREVGWTAQYEITAHAYIVSAPTGTTVTLAADETSYSGRVLDPTIRQQRVNNKSGGRAKATWMAMRAIQTILLSDSVKATLSGIASSPNASPTPADTAFVGWLSRKVFMLPSCDLAKTIPEEEKVRFPSESEAKAAGFVRSGATGC